MSIEPEVPYSYSNEDSSDDDNGTWRDQSLSQRAQPVSRANVVQNDRGRDNLGTPSTQQQQERDPFVDRTVASDTGHRNPDGYWVLPAYCNPKEILGKNYKERSNEIQKAAGSFIEFNEGLNQVDIWGDQEALDKTKAYLDMIVARYTEKDTALARKTAKWGKPERELTPKEKRRAEKRQARLDEERQYQGLPTMMQNYFATFNMPNTSLVLPKLLGENDAYINQIRADCKAFLWFDSKDNAIRIASDTEDSLKQAATRIRNWYLRCSRKPEGGTIRLMQQPKNQCLLSFRTLPTGFVTYKYADPEREANLLKKNRLFEPVVTGLPRRIHHDDLISFKDDDSTEQLSDQAKTLNDRNKVFIERLLSRGLESIRLNDWSLRMKIRFGQICLIDYPRKDGQFLTIEEVSDKMFRKPLFKSALAPCISKTKAVLDSLFEYLASADNAVEYSDNPRTSFTITARQYPTAAPPIKIPGLRNQPREVDRGEMWETVMDISFTEDGHRKLWNTITDCADLVDINCLDIESHYSWDLKLQHARRLPSDDPDSPHEKFSRSLSVNNSGNRLILVTSSEYIPQLVSQKTKWRYGWKDFVVEICKDEIWDMNRVERKDRELPVDLTPIEPHRSLFKISLYKEAWVNRFAENLDLKIGEAPTWTLRDFFASHDENVQTIMESVKAFSDTLNAEVPLYWDQSGQPLV